MDYDFAKVLYSCRSVDHLGSWILDLGSWILNIYIILEIWCGEYTHQYTSSIYLNDITTDLLRRIEKKLIKNNANWTKK